MKKRLHPKKVRCYNQLLYKFVTTYNIITVSIVINVLKLRGDWESHRVDANAPVPFRRRVQKCALETDKVHAFQVFIYL